ncbi:HdeD family acid-resistance protein [Pedosphaera parvula]|uniref:HdeD protein n=1 Tax=Pedosphaera parvula (strain Ellin514) TaxID=320771 RepID=B9XDS3_PEDPL|nr:HdeD family acid-resistance protein [Pedosphaera parvula]EEF62219.1 conserved hypothetical protein [Pedosphaera parvula Ellin514]
MAITTASTSLFAADMEEARHKWGWLLALGIGLIVLGIIATYAAVATTVATVLFFGAILLVEGIFEIVGGIRNHRYGGFWLHLASGILGIVCGILILLAPVASALALTVVFAAFFLVGGFYKIFASASIRLPGWGWSLFSGALDVVLGLMLLTRWPFSGLWFIGLAVGITLIFQGWAWVMLATLLHRTETPVATPA